MNIGDKIKANRLQREWTQEQLAELLNVSRSTVSSWEVGRNYPDLETIVALSDLFGISLDILLREDQKMTKTVTKKIKMNKVYKIILAVIGVLVLCYVGFNVKLRMDENKYRSNLDHYGWKHENQENDYAGETNSYELKEAGTSYFTYVMPVGLQGFPMEEQKIWVIARKEPFVIDVRGNDWIEIVVTKNFAPDAKYFGKIKVDADLQKIEVASEGSEKKKAYLKDYVNEHKKEYQQLIKETLTKRDQIITKR